MSSKQVRGRCHCGQIEISATVDTDKVMACHCSDCQTFSGAPYRAVAMVPAAEIRIQGEPREYVKVADSGNKRFQAFCPNCGTQLYAADAGKTIYNVRTGFLDAHGDLHPVKHIFGQSAVSWVHDLSETPWHETGPNSVLCDPKTGQPK